MDENFILDNTVLASRSWQMLNQTPMVPNFPSALPTPRICTANVGFGKVKDGVGIVEAMEPFRSRNSKTSKKTTIANSEQL